MGKTRSHLLHQNSNLRYFNQSRRKTIGCSRQNSNVWPLAPKTKTILQYFMIFFFLQLYYLLNRRIFKFKNESIKKIIFGALLKMA